MSATTLPEPQASSGAERDGPATGEPAAVAFEERDGELALGLSGAWRLGAPRPELGELEQRLQREPALVRFSARVDLAWDTALLVWLSGASALAQRAGAKVDRSRLPAGVADLLALAETALEAPRREQRPPRFLARVGSRATRLWRGIVEDVSFVGQVALALARCAVLRARFRAPDLAHWVQASGADAVPIVTLVSVVVGAILAFVGAVQLRQFGAHLYVANMVGIAMAREMGAMVVGIVIAGRTGAAFAAQLGTMKVTQEIDALRTFGIRPVEFLVLPRVIALAAMSPLLCLYSIVLGIVGGALVGIGMFGISPQLYLDQTLQSLALVDVYSGIFRGTVYGLLVGIAGCLRGMRCGNDAAAVGEATTSAVVSAIVAIAVADGVMAVCSNALGI